MPIMQFEVYGCLLFLCWFGAKIIILINASTMTTGDLSSMIAYAMNILNCLMMLFITSIGNDQYGKSIM